MNNASKWLQSILSLLSPPSYKCLTCGELGQPSPLSPILCETCAAHIPWIRTVRCLTCGRHVGCPDCTRSREPSPILCNRSAVAYSSVMREWLGQYKYRGNEQYAPLLGLMLERAYQMLRAEHEELIRQNNPHSCATSFTKFFRTRRGHPFFGSPYIDSWQADILVPVPVSESRLIERGFNQAERLAIELSKRTGIPVLPLLKRIQHTDKQSFKGRAERLFAMKHAFGTDASTHEYYSEWLIANMNTLSTSSVSLEPSISDTQQSRPVRIIIVDDIYTTGSTLRACAESIIQMTKAYPFPCDIYSLTWARS